MSENKPPIYGTCKAGCLFPTVHYDDFAQIAGYVAQPIVNGVATLSPLKKYRIEVDSVPTSSPVLPFGGAMTEMSAVAVGTKIYLFGGCPNNAGIATNYIQIYDTITKTVSLATTTLPQAMSDLAAVLVGTNIYLFSGETHSIYLFDTTTHNISTLSTTIDTNLTSVRAAAVGTNIYFCGTGSTTVYIFNTSTKTISTLSTALPSGKNIMAIAAVGTKVYLFSASITIYEVNTTAGTITAISAGTRPAVGMGVATIDTKIYLFGGKSTDNGYGIDTIQMLDSETNNIYPLSEKLTGAKSYMGVAAVGANIYLCGGYTAEDDIVNAIDVFYTSTLGVGVSLCNISGAQDYKLPIMVYDKYRNYFDFEIVGLNVNTSGLNLTITYEVNNERNVVTITGENINVNDAVLKITNAKSIYLLGATSSGGANTETSNCDTIFEGNIIAGSELTYDFSQYKKIKVYVAFPFCNATFDIDLVNGHPDPSEEAFLKYFGDVALPYRGYTGGVTVMSREGHGIEYMAGASVNLEKNKLNFFEAGYKHLTEKKVDGELSNTSTNPIQNRAVYYAIRPTIIYNGALKMGETLSYDFSKFKRLKIYYRFATTGGVFEMQLEAASESTAGGNSVDPYSAADIGNTIENVNYISLIKVSVNAAKNLLTVVRTGYFNISTSPATWNERSNEAYYVYKIEGWEW